MLSAVSKPELPGGGGGGGGGQERANKEVGMKWKQMGMPIRNMQVRNMIKR